MNTKLRVCGLWKHTDGQGRAYYKGNINKGLKILVFKNNSKTTESQPDFEVFLDSVEFTKEKIETSEEL